MINYARTKISQIPSLAIVPCEYLGGFYIRHDDSTINFKMINDGIDMKPVNFTNYNALICDKYRPNGRYDSCLLVPQDPTNVEYSKILLASGQGALLVGTSYWADVQCTPMGYEEAIATSKIIHTHHDTDLTLIAIAMRKSVRLVTHAGLLFEPIVSVLTHAAYMPHVAISRMLSNPLSGFMINCNHDDIDMYIEKVMNVNI